jgi:hypothetical protein
MKKRLWLALGGSLFLLCLSAWGSPQGRIALSQESFVSPDYKSTAKKDFQFVGVGVDTLTKVKNENEIEDSLQAQIQANLAPGASVLNYLNVSQLFWKQQGLIFGRKKLVWSQLDESYNLGIYQPNFNWNVLQPESQGLTGLFLRVEAQDTKIPVGIYLFASSLFIPDQGSGYEIKDGQFQESNPYFHAPPTAAVINGQNDSVVYNLQRPRTEDVIFKRSFAAKAYLGNDDDGIFGQFSYANKPSNQLTLGFQGVIVPNNAIAVDILPAVYEHRILSGDLQYTYSGVSLGMSALQETIGEPNYSSEWTYAKYTNAQLLSPYLRTHFKGLNAKLSYLQIRGGEKKVIGPRASLADSILPNRYPFSNAYLAELSYRYRIRRFQGIEISTRYLTGEKSEFALLTGRGAYQWEERWSAFFETQLASVDNSELGKAIAYHSYMNNDTASIGVQHVF